jgi:DivIVA domain-containing protein
MEMSPQTVRSTGFKVVKKGYDPEEVDAFKEQVASAVEFAQNQATAMEARARAAVAKLQEVSQQVASGATHAPAAPAGGGDAEVISRTLLLAQRTADTTVNEARLEAESLLANARDEAGRVIDTARNMAAKTVDDARFEARRAVDDERVKAENEVQALLARRDFLLADVDHLEQYLQAQRERLRDAAVQIQDLVERVPGGLGDMRRPLLSASADPLPPSMAALPPEQAITGEITMPPGAVTVDDLPPPPRVSFADAPTGEIPRPDTPAPAAISALALSGDPDAHDHVWRMLDEEVAQRAADATGEIPRPVPAPDPFHIDEEDLQ